MMRLVTLLTLSTLAFLWRLRPHFFLREHDATASTTTGTTNHNCIILRAGVIPDTSTSSSSYDSPIHFSDILIIYITSIISASPPPEMPERQYVES
mmetsp:Transcript_10146/g.15759  ORF Transcript_10146/g.15759 Transcript_10146/m.15759 type:complete len:96 (+) Transcript_10146:1021-1308(+)